MTLPKPWSVEGAASRGTPFVAEFWLGVRPIMLAAPPAQEAWVSRVGAATCCRLVPRVQPSRSGRALAHEGDGSQLGATNSGRCPQSICGQAVHVHANAIEGSMHVHVQQATAVAGLIQHGKGQLLSQGSTARSSPLPYQVPAAMQALAPLAQALHNSITSDPVHMTASAASGVATEVWKQPCCRHHQRQHRHCHWQPGQLSGISPMSTALIKGPEGLNALAATAAPVGYHPAMKYCRANAPEPAATGVDMEVPRSMARSQLLVLVLLQPAQPPCGEGDGSIAAGNCTKAQAFPWMLGCQTGTETSNRGQDQRGPCGSSTKGSAFRKLHCMWLAGVMSYA